MRIFASRQCADCVRAENAGAGEAHMACYVCEFAIEAVWCCSIQAAMAPSSPTSISITKEHRTVSESSVSECVRLCDAHIKSYGPYLYPVCNDIQRDIPECDPPHTL